MVSPKYFISFKNESDSVYECDSVYKLSCLSAGPGVDVVPW